MPTHSVSVTLKKGGAAQMIASVTAETPHAVHVLIRNVGEGNAEVKQFGVTVPAETTLEPHSARLMTLGKGGVILAKCTSPDTYTVLLLDIRVAAELDSV